MNRKESRGARFHRRDAVEIAVGACVMAFPVATTEEIWNLGAELALGRVLLFACASLFFLAAFIFVLHGHVGAPLTSRAFVLRVSSTYGLTLLISALLLSGVDRLDLLEHPLIGLKRAILVAFPASFAATVVDSLADRSRRDA